MFCASLECMSLQSGSAVKGKCSDRSKLSKLMLNFALTLIEKGIKTEKNGLTSPINRIALRKTKIAHNFGISECNRVKYNLLYAL